MIVFHLIIGLCELYSYLFNRTFSPFFLLYFTMPYHILFYPILYFYDLWLITIFIDFLIFCFLLCAPYNDSFEKKYYETFRFIYAEQYMILLTGCWMVYEIFHELGY